MSLPGNINQLLIGAAASAGGGGYEIQRSLRFNKDDSAYLDRTFTNAGDRRKWTWSGWVKRTNLGIKYRFFGNLNSSGLQGQHFEFNTSDQFRFVDATSSIQYELITSNVYRDTSAWYHFVVVQDTTESTASDRLKIYVNGNQVTNFSTSTYPSSDEEGRLNTPQEHAIGRSGALSQEYFNGYFSNIHFIDGQALAASDFGEYDNNNVWRPKEYTGTYNPQVNNSQDWSSAPYNSGNTSDPSYPATNAFNGSIGTTYTDGWLPANGNTITWTSDGNFSSATSVQIYYIATGSGALTVNGGSVTTTNDSTVRSVIVDVTGTGFTGFTNNWVTSPNGPMAVLAVEVDGVRLVDTTVSSATSNSFHLDFSDNSSNAALGTDSSGNSNTWTVNNLIAESPLSLPGVRFDGSGDYLTVPASADNNYGTSDFTMEWYQKWTNLSGYQTIWSNNYTSSLLVQTDTGTGKYRVYAGGSYLFVETDAPEVGRWYHYALVRNGNTFTIYRDGTANGSVSSTNSVGDSTNVATIGQGSTNYVKGVISNFRVVKGTAVYTSDFTRPTTPLTNITNTVLLCCQSDTSTTEAAVSPGALTASGDPVAGTFNDSSPANDSLIDSPTNYTAESGNNGGNYCTLNELSNGVGTDPKNGNLDFTSAAVSVSTRCNSTIAVSSGKYYFETTMTTGATGSSPRTVVGIGQHFFTDKYVGEDADSYGFTLDQGYIYNNGSGSSYATALSNGDVFMCAFDLDNNKIFFGSDGTWFNSSDPVAGTSPAFTINTGTYCVAYRPSSIATNTTEVSFNFGQRQFAYTPPTGYVSLCTTNLSEATIADGSDYFDTKLYTGNGSTQSISGYDFSPDFVWLKGRSGTRNHGLFDTVRGVNKGLHSNLTDAEFDDSSTLTAFNSNGFDLSTNVTFNANTETFVAWAWDAGTLTESNTDGTITSQVRANQSTGCSVVSYTGNGTAGATIGHGLNAEPGFVVFKSRSASGNWLTYHKSLGGNYYLFLESTAAQVNLASTFGVSSSTLTVQTYSNYNASGTTYIAYCFAPVEGFSAFGSYTGNGSSDGPFIYTGFKPAWVLYKKTNSTSDWYLDDYKRLGYNFANKNVYPNDPGVESSGSFTDFLSNGFKLRSSSGVRNGSGDTFIYAAFAENPFQVNGGIAR